MINKVANNSKEQNQKHFLPLDSSLSGTKQWCLRGVIFWRWNEHSESDIFLQKNNKEDQGNKEISNEKNFVDEIKKLAMKCLWAKIKRRSRQWRKNQQEKHRLSAYYLDVKMHKIGSTARCPSSRKSKWRLK